MTQVVIRVAEVGKCYQIYDRPQDRLKQSIIPRIHRLAELAGSRRKPTTYFREFWALRDVSFHVEKGEFVGIIGRNGAGKSTLLQIIAGTLTPTVGMVSVNGRVAALLELGSGFNPEFTGRENVHLNAALLGLSKDETASKFEEIAAFADIGDFIDQPVKSYSSGMQMRLAFAVQTAVDPSVLIVDEALAVGDVFFQAKCMARLRRLVEEGTTILLVTHDTGTVRQMCDRAILLQNGRIIAEGGASKVADSYLRLELEERNSLARSSRSLGGYENDDSNIHSMEAVGQEGADEGDPVSLGMNVFKKRAMLNRIGNGSAEIINVQLLKRGRISDVFDFGDTVTLRQVVAFRETLENVNIVYKIRTPQGVDIVFGDTRLQGEMSRTYLGNRTYVFDWTFDVCLMHGSYCVMSGVTKPPSIDYQDWIFIDMVPFCYEFRVSPRRNGMIDGFIAWKNQLRVNDGLLG